MLYLPVILRALLLLCCLSITPTLAAQSLLERLAERVCDCMERAPELVYPRIQAARCVDEVASNYGDDIGKQLQLNVERTEDRRRLSELLIDPLTTGCPLLQELTDEQSEPELHYSDYDLLATGRRYRSEKQPAADPIASTSKESPSTVTISGTVASVSHRQFRLRTVEGALLEIEYQPRQLRGGAPEPGETVTLRYRSDWRGAGTTVRYLLVEIK